MRVLHLSWCLAAILLLFPWPAIAACTIGNAAGRWQSYTVGNAGWTRCTLKVGATGIIDQAVSLCSDQTDRLTKIGGRVSLNDGARCAFRARITFVTGGAVQRVVEMSMSADKLTATGVGRGDGGVIFLITLVKIL